MDRRKFIIATGAGITGSVLTTQKEGIATASPSDSEAVGHGAGPDRNPERYGRGVGDPSSHLHKDAASGREITTNSTDQEQVVLSGQLTGNFSSDVGRMEVSAFGEHNSVDILSNGSFSADVPQDEPLDIAYIQQAGPDSFINLNGNPDTYYVKQIDGLSEDRDLGTIEIPEGHLLDLKFENETGESLDGITASVRSLDTDTDRWYEIFTTTNSNGFYQATDSSTGIEVNGRIQVAVLADEDDPRVPDVSYTVNEFTVTESRAETITVNPITASGKFTLPSGSPAVGDDVSVFINADDSAGAITDGEGSFEIQLPQSDDFIPGAYQIQYYRPRLRDESGDGVEGNWVDMYAGPQLDGTSDEDVGTIELPEGDRVQVRTIDEDGNIVENAAVRYRHLNETEDSGASIGFETDETGIASLNGQTGLRLSGTVDITASPPDIDRLADTTAERTITVDEPMTVDLTLPLEDGDGSQIEDPTQRVLQITNKNSPSELTQNDVTATITRFERGQTVNGIDIKQDDVTNIITLFGRS